MNKTALFLALILSFILVQTIVLATETCTGSLVEDCSIYADNETDCPLHYWSNGTHYLQCYFEVSGEPVCWTYTGITCNLLSINYTSPYPQNTSWNYCSDNQTLRIHLAQYDNGTFISSNDSYVICPYGCFGDSCNWNPIYSYLSALIVLIIITLTLWRLFK